tara:strand:- start:68 stop:1435 length:1368 start_codon:yes stop_codon:yes gene_type:complete
MNKIKQNKLTFRLILAAIAIIFSSFTILSLPVLFNYKSKVDIIEKNFYKNFKIYLKSGDKISYKPFPKPHLLVENASLSLHKSSNKRNLLNSDNLKIFISLRDIYLRSFNNIISSQISDTNIELYMSDIIDIRKHLYEKINEPIVLNNCKIFIKNKNNEVILISPVNKISYKINNKNKFKQFIFDGEIFGLKYKSEWKRNYAKPTTTLQSINIFNPNIEIKNIFKFINNKKFNGLTEIVYSKDKLNYNFSFRNNSLKINSPEAKNTNFNLDSEIQLSPFYFKGELIIKNKKVESIIDNLLINLLMYDENYLNNVNGELKIKFKDLNNKLIKNGEIDLIVNDKKINLIEARFDLDKIGYIKTELSFSEIQGELKFIAKNRLIIENHIEFAKIFQISSKKIKNINQMDFDIEKDLGDNNFIISNIKIDNKENKNSSSEVFLVKNIQNLRSYIRKVID